MTEKRIRSLDGLRTVAIFSVIALHLGWGATGGYLGVDIFFVLSGFVITRVLLSEYGETGRISITAFYWRRFLRLAPALLFVVLSYLVIAWILHPNDMRAHALEAAFALTYLTNLNLIQWWPNTGFLNHTWSLSIEEQFYIIWAPMAVFILGFGGKRGMAIFATFAIFIVAIWRYSFVVKLDHDLAYWRIYHGFDTRCDELLTGCLLAAMLTPKISDLASRTWIIPAVYLGYGILFFPSTSLFTSEIGALPIAIAAAWIIAGLVAERHNLLARILSTRVFVYFGALSYSMYLWNWVLVRVFREIAPLSANALAFFGTIIAAVISYHFIERPALRLRDWKLASKIEEKPSEVGS